jgi:hypothetical protein
VRGLVSKGSAALTLVAFAALAALVGCHKPEREYKKHGLELPPANAEHAATVPSPITLEPRTPLLVAYPCSRCHANQKPNPERRVLVKFHVLRNTELHHGDSQKWCYHCHSIENIDRLVLPSGTLVEFDEAPKLCGSCHGDKLRDWNLQVHGKTMGHWQGAKVRRACTGCHNPHRPAFQPIEPEPAPPSPEQVSAAFMQGQMR